jgi:hypothetical protein
MNDYYPFHSVDIYAPHIYLQNGRDIMRCMKQISFPSVKAQDHEETSEETKYTTTGRRIHRYSQAVFHDRSTYHDAISWVARHIGVP